MAGKREHPQPIVGILVVHDGKLMLIAKGKKWAHPLGSIEFGEEPAEAVNRLLAEYALDAAPQRLIGVHNIIEQKLARELEFAKGHLLVLEYLCNAKSMFAKKDHVAADIRWVTAREAAKLPLMHYTEELLLLYKPKPERMIKPWQQRIKKR